jgi:hypothetical protein
MIPSFISWLLRNYRKPKMRLAWQPSAVTEKKYISGKPMPIALIANLKYNAHETGHS